MKCLSPCWKLIVMKVSLCAGGLGELYKLIFMTNTVPNIPLLHITDEIKRGDVSCTRSSGKKQALAQTQKFLIYI